MSTPKIEFSRGFCSATSKSTSFGKRKGPQRLKKVISASLTAPSSLIEAVFTSANKSCREKSSDRVSRPRSAALVPDGAAADDESPAQALDVSRQFNNATKTATTIMKRIWGSSPLRLGTLFLPE